MCTGQAIFTCWWMVIKGQGDVLRSGDIYLVVVGDKGARRCGEVR